MLRALRLPSIVKLPHANFELFLFSSEISLIGNYEFLVGGTVPGKWLVVGKCGPDKWAKYSANQQAGQHKPPGSNLEGRGTMRHHLRDIHFAPLMLGGGLQLVDARDHFVDRIGLKKILHTHLPSLKPLPTVKMIASVSAVRSSPAPAISGLVLMASNREVEIKFRVRDLRALTRKLRAAGFRLVTRRTHEVNTLYDLPGEVLRGRRELLRIRKYGSTWTLTHKAKGKIGKHSSRVETETGVADGKKMDAILRALGYAPSFRYEKFRAEWTDGKGQVVVDETPIGNFCEIEGPPRWIDATAEKLGVDAADYITKNYAGLFGEWKRRAESSAREMTFEEVASRTPLR